MLDSINFKIIFGSLLHTLLSNNIIQIIWCAGMLILMLILAIIHHKWAFDYGKKMIIWRILCLLPAGMAAAHYSLYLNGRPVSEILSFAPMYSIAVLALIPIIFASREKGYKVSATFVGIFSVLFGLVFSAMGAPHLYNYSKLGYSDSFTALVKTMERTYVLKEWKDVDFPGLEKKYMPMVKEAEAKHDTAAYAKVLKQFCGELHDGHVGIEYDDSDFVPRDYGLGLVKLDSGDVIAVRTMDEVHQEGITDGTVITAWNGKPVLQAAEEDVQDIGLPVKANADMTSVIRLSCVGGATNEVTFIDDEGNEKTVTLYDLIDSPDDVEKIHSFSDTYGLFAQLPDKGEEPENFSTKMLDDKCGYLLVNEESTDNPIYDIAGYLNGDHKWAREMFREKLKDLRSQGMEYLVIDLRNNSGGSDEIGFALVDLLTKEPQFGLNVGYRFKGEYKPLADHGIKGDGEFADLKVVALTNYNCGSAGDSLAKALGDLPNVTLAGITDPCGCNQETGGEIILAEDSIKIYYPTGLVLDEKGDPNIDTKADRISRDPVEERIPFDADAAMKIFHDMEDHELDWAVKYLEGK